MCQVPLQLDVRWHWLGPRRPAGAGAGAGGDDPVRGGGFVAADVADPGVLDAPAYREVQPLLLWSGGASPRLCGMLLVCCCVGAPPHLIEDMPTAG
jgi:hypothetical protein